jgi:hypothetical protein
MGIRTTRSRGRARRWTTFSTRPGLSDADSRSQMLSASGTACQVLGIKESKGGSRGGALLCLLGGVRGGSCPRPADRGAGGAHELPRRRRQENGKPAVRDWSRAASCPHQFVILEIVAGPGSRSTRTRKSRNVTEIARQAPGHPRRAIYRRATCTHGACRIRLRSRPAPGRRWCSGDPRRRDPAAQGRPGLAALQVLATRPAQEPGKPALRGRSSRRAAQPLHTSWRSGRDARGVEAHVMTEATRRFSRHPSARCRAPLTT